MDSGSNTSNPGRPAAAKMKVWVKPVAEKADVRAITASNLIGNGADGAANCSS